MIRNLKRFAVCIPLGIFMVLAGCASHSVRLAEHTMYKSQNEAGLSAAQLSRLTDNCGPFGAPELSDNWEFGPTTTVFRDGYVLQHSGMDKIPLWVCEHVTRDEISGSLPRKDAFKADPECPEGQRAELEDYRGSGFDRGHMAPAGNQTVDARLKKETFYLSNMAPQTAALNQKIWAGLEETVRQWAQAEGDVWTYTGNMFFDPQEENAATADGLIPYEIIGPGEVAVPTHCYKIVLAKTAQSWRAIGFVMANQRKQFPKPYDFAAYSVPISWIEERTGLNFMPLLDPALKNRLENQPAVLADWGLN